MCRPHPYSDAMRFERIFEDLEGRFEHHEREQMRAVSEDLTRAERADLTMADQLRGNLGREIIVHAGTALRLTGIIEATGQDWLELRDSSASSRVVIPFAAIGMVQGLSGRARPEPSSALPAPRLSSLLRSLARDRAVVRIETTAGSVTGRIAAVSADSLDVHSLPTGEHATVPGSARISVMTSAVQAVIAG